MNIFVANLSYRLSDDDLSQLFEAYGEVSSARIVMDRETGRSRGFGFVEMGDEDGKSAIEALDQHELDGRPIVVKEAEERSNNRGGGRGGNRGGGYGRGGNSRY